ncbi:ift122 [Symbiodinium sp. CCMP2592]|nr:ift122 [Symbiodinium sp. CCMP2592]
MAADTISPPRSPCASVRSGSDNPGEEVDEFNKGIVDFIASRQATRPGVVRAVRAGRVLQNFGRVLRNIDIDAEQLYQMGSQSESIQEFWSHSWHASATWKVWLLLMLKRGKAASLVGTAVALAIAVLSYMEWLPAWYRPAMYKSPEVQELKASPWCLCGGLLAFFLTLLYWPSSDQVFLDRACIHQADQDLKTEGVVNIAAFLEKSKSLVVVWDRLYMSRAWCVFELAAFLSRHKNSKPIPVVVKPLGLAPLTFVMTAGISLLMAYEISLPSDGLLLYGKLVCLVLWAITFNWVFRRCLENVLTVEEQCRTFSWAAVQSHCCSVNHVEKGVAIPCDKELLSSCISRWFGSIEAFEGFVSTDVRDICVEQLLRIPMGYWWSVTFNAFVFWGHFDIAVSRAHAGDAAFAVGMLCSGVAWTFWITPVQYIALARMAMWQAKSRERWLLRGIVVNLGGIFSCFMPFVLQQGSYIFFMPNSLLAHAVFMLVSLFWALVLFYVLARSSF